MYDETSRLRNRIAVRAIKDQKFRKALIAKPVRTIRSEFGVVLPKGVKVRIVEAELDTTYIVIPQRPRDWPARLSASEALARLKEALESPHDEARCVVEGVLGLIALALVDKKFAATLTRSPASAMREVGVGLPDGVKVVVLQESNRERIFVIPASRTKVAITEEDLDTAAGLYQTSPVPIVVSTNSIGCVAMPSWPWDCSNPATWCPACFPGFGLDDLVNPPPARRLRARGGASRSRR